MARFRQADPDPEKADRDGVTKYVPARRQINLNFTCADCPRTATWEIKTEGKRFHACAEHRAERALTTPGTYQERRL